MRTAMLLGALLQAALAAQAAAPARRVVFENEKVLVSELVFEPGDEEAEHTHATDLVAVVIAGGPVESTAPGGEVTLQGGQPGDVFFLPMGSTHRTLNGSGARVVLRVIALK